MQEEVENRTVNLAVQSTKLTFRALYAAWKKFRDHERQKAAGKASVEDDVVKGEQSVKDLIGQGQGASSVPIEKEGLRDFRKTARKYGVDFAVVKSKDDPPKYTIFFKAKDKDAIDKAMAVYTAKQMNVEKGAKKSKADKATEKEAERPSLRKKLAKFKEIASKTPRKAKEKRKEIDR